MDELHLYVSRRVQEVAAALGYACHEALGLVMAELDAPTAAKYAAWLLWKK